MALLTTRTLALSLSLLLTSTSLTQAGFVWLSPAGQPAPAAEAQPKQEAEVPVVSAVAESPPPAETLSVPAPVAAPVADPMPTQTDPMLAAPVGGTALLRSETVMGQPSYAPGDQPAPTPTPAPAPSPAPSPASLPPVLSAPVLSAVPPESAPPVSAPVAPVMSPITAEPVQPDVTLGQMGEAGSPVAPLPQGTEPVTLMPVEAPATVVPPESQAASPSPSASVSLVTGQPVASSAPPAPAHAGTASPGGDRVVDGFGKQVPLIVALRQILPPAYGFAHRDGVDLTQSVDWKGGRPWQQVLTEALTPVGLKAAVTADTVLIEKMDAPAAPPVSSAAPPPAPAAAEAPAAPAGPAGEGTSARLTNATIMQSPPQGR